MSDHNNNTLYGIDKYSGSFSQDDMGVTLIPNDTINLLTDFTLLALFTFLASCSSNWKLNAKHLATHFKCNKDKIYKAIDDLIELNLLTRTIIRENGKFSQYHYRLHLRPTINQNVQATPFPEKPDTVKPDTVNPDTYKTKNLKNINVKKRDISSGDQIFDSDNKNNPYPDTYYHSHEQANDEKIIEEMKANNPYQIEEIYLRTWFENRKQNRKYVNAATWSLMLNDLYKYAENGLNPVLCFERMAKNGWMSLDLKRELTNKELRVKKETILDHTDTSWINGLHKDIL